MEESDINNWLTKMTEAFTEDLLGQVCFSDEEYGQIIHREANVVYVHFKE